jgi:hypothetical protein
VPTTAPCGKSTSGLAIGDVAPPQACADHDSVGQPRRHVLCRMHAYIDAPVEQRLVDFLGEQALAACLGDRTVGDAVARRPHGHDDDLRSRHPK